jgi:hypothetical protein
MRVARIAATAMTACTVTTVPRSIAPDFPLDAGSETIGAT